MCVKYRILNGGLRLAWNRGCFLMAPERPPFNIPVDSLLGVEDPISEDGPARLQWGAPGEAHKAAGH